jgi:uncharacterized membrane protein
MRRFTTNVARAAVGVFDVLTIRSRRDERGAIAVIAALALPMVFAATALSFDIGREVDTNRSTQALADAIALDAATFLDGTPANYPDNIAGSIGVPLPASFGIPTLDQVIQYEGSLSAMRNGLDPASSAAGRDVLAIGSCTAGGPDVRCATFNPVEECPLTTALPLPGAAGSCAPVAGADPTTILDAVQMQTSEVTSFVFGAGSATSARHATAMNLPPCLLSAPGACCPSSTTLCCTSIIQCPTPNQPAFNGVSSFSLGSGLAEIRTQGPSCALACKFLDGILAQELQTSSSDIDLLSFNGLSNASLSLGDILAANSSVGTLSSLLTSNVTPGQALSWFYNGLVYVGGSSDISAADQFSQDLGTNQSGATLVGASGNLQLCQLFSVNLPGSGSTSACNIPSGQQPLLASAQIDALDYLTSVAELINGKHVLSVSMADNTPTDTGLGNIVAQVTVEAISPVDSVGPASAPPTVGGKCPSLINPGTGSAFVCPLTAIDQQAKVSVSIPNLVSGINLDMSVVGAQATGTLQALTCGVGGVPDQLTIGGSTGLAAIDSTFTATSQTIPTTIPTTIPPVTIPPVVSTLLPSTTSTTKPLIQLPTTTTTTTIPPTTTTTTTTIPPTTTTTQPVVSTNFTASNSVSIPGTTFSHTFSGPFQQLPTATPAPWTSDNPVSLPAISIPVPALPSWILPGVQTLLGSRVGALDSQLADLLDALSVNLGYATVTDQSVNCSVPTLVGA